MPNGVTDKLVELWNWATGTEPARPPPKPAPIAPPDQYCKNPSVATVRADGTPIQLVPPSSGGAPSTDHRKLRAAFDALPVPASQGTVSRIDDNTHAFASRWNTLASATQSFDTTYFIWEKDIFGFAYLGHMYKKAKEGLRIRGMLDATGDPAGTKSFKGAEDYLEELVAVDPSRVQFGIFNPVLKKDYGTWASAIASNHDKLAIADGRVVETGGRNMAAHYFSDPQDMHGVYRDTDVHLESAVAGRSATAAFEAEFNAAHTKKVTPDWGGNWDSQAAILMGAYLMMNDWLHGPALTPAEKRALRTDAKARERAVDEVMKKVERQLPREGIEPSGGELHELRELAGQLVTNPELRGKASFAAQVHRADVKILDNVSAATKSARKMEINDSLIALTKVAQHSIVIHNPYVVLTDKAIQALSDAADRGVQVIFGTNSPESSDSAVTQAFFLEDWAKVMARVRNSRVIVARGAEKHHSKTFVIDGVITGVSSFNADWISARVNSEDVAVMWSEPFARNTLESYAQIVADPRHKVVEYKIMRDADGRALLRDGQPIVEYGPDCHVPAEMMKKYVPLRKAANAARERIGELAPLRQRPLDPATDHVRTVP